MRNTREEGEGELFSSVVPSAPRLRALTRIESEILSRGEGAIVTPGILICYRLVYYGCWSSEDYRLLFMIRNRFKLMINISAGGFRVCGAVYVMNMYEVNKVDSDGGVGSFARRL